MVPTVPLGLGPALPGQRATAPAAASTPVQAVGPRDRFVRQAPAAPPADPGVGVLDAESLFAGLQTFCQGTAGALAHVAWLFGRYGKAVVATASVLDGSPTVIANLGASLVRGVKAAASALAPAHAAQLVGVAEPAVAQAGRALATLGKVAPALNVIAAAYDIWRAAHVRHRGRQDAAWANAALSVASTAMAVGSVLVAGATLGPALGLGAAAIALTQLLDGFLAHHRLVRWLGKHVVGPMREAPQT
jgi:hypothetical protein